MGHRRVGKTVILYQSIYKLLKSGINPIRGYDVPTATT